jgi:hypothetical protein
LFLPQEGAQPRPQHFAAIVEPYALDGLRLFFVSSWD